MAAADGEADFDEGPSDEDVDADDDTAMQPVRGYMRHRPGITPELAARRSRMKANRLQRRSDAQDIAGRLIAARELNGLTQTEAAELLGFKNSAQLSRLESGDRPVMLEHVVRMADIYRVDINWLCCLSSDMEQPHDARELVMHAMTGAISSVARALHDQVEGVFAAVGGVGAAHVRSLTRSGLALAAAVDLLIERNHSVFEELKGGAAVQRLLAEHRAGLLEATKAVGVLDGLDARLRQKVQAAMLEQAQPGA